MTGKKFVSSGFGLLVTLAFAGAPAAALAQAPEFGRCLALAGKDGGYRNAACTSASPRKTGRYEWYPGAARDRFTSESKGAAKIVFEGVNDVRVGCTGQTSTGEYASPKLEEHVVFTFTGCTTDGLAVSSAGAASGEVLTNPTECELGVLQKGGTPKSDRVGLSCAEEGAFVWMKWGNPLSPYRVEWCLRGWWFFTTAANHMQAVTDLTSQQSHGLQYWEKFAAGPPEPLEASFDGGTTWERAALALHSVQTNEEPIEANTVF